MERFEICEVLGPDKGVNFEKCSLGSFLLEVKFGSCMLSMLELTLCGVQYMVQVRHGDVRID